LCRWPWWIWSFPVGVKRNPVHETTACEIAWWVGVGGAGYKMDLMLPDVYGGGSYMCFSLRISLCPASWYPCVFWGMYWSFARHMWCCIILLLSGIAVIVIYTPIGTVCLCHTGDIVFNLVFEHLYVLVVVCVGMPLVKEFYSCLVLHNKTTHKYLAF
jgi:hypothetical protein